MLVSLVIKNIYFTDVYTKSIAEIKCQLHTFTFGEMFIQQ